MLSGKATNTKYIVFEMTRSVHERTIYRTREEHANHYITVVVICQVEKCTQKIYSKFKLIRSFSHSIHICMKYSCHDLMYTDTSYQAAEKKNSQKLIVLFLVQNCRNCTIQKLPVIQYLLFGFKQVGKFWDKNCPCSHKNKIISFVQS